jgi:branched-chain amino acid transport system ATP-binding protein/urea transport system ATP-binding protein
MSILLEARTLHKTSGQLAALGGADFAVESRQFHGLIGPNGSGKSTLLKCLAGAEVPTSGGIYLAGEDITELPPAERSRRGLSLKFQITAVLPALTLYDNVQLALLGHAPLGRLLLGHGARRERVMELLDMVRLTGRAHEPASALSHGEQQWLEIAMALSAEPRVLLLDEPTGGMSVEERRVTGELLRPIKDRCSLVIVEHDLDFIRGLCDRLTVLDQGRVIASGTVAEIQSDQRVQEAYVRRV